MYNKDKFAWRNSKPKTKRYNTAVRHTPCRHWGGVPETWTLWGVVCTVPVVCFWLWLNLTFIGNISNPLTGTSFNQCEPEVNNSPVEESCLFLTSRRDSLRFQRNPHPPCAITQCLGWKHHESFYATPLRIICLLLSIRMRPSCLRIPLQTILIIISPCADQWLADLRVDWGYDIWQEEQRLTCWIKDSVLNEPLEHHYFAFRSGIERQRRR